MVPPKKLSDYRKWAAVRIERSITRLGASLKKERVITSAGEAGMARTPTMFKLKSIVDLTRSTYYRWRERTRLRSLQEEPSGPKYVQANRS